MYPKYHDFAEATFVLKPTICLPDDDTPEDSCDCCCDCYEDDSEDGILDKLVFVVRYADDCADDYDQAESKAEELREMGYMAVAVPDSTEVYFQDK